MANVIKVLAVLLLAGFAVLLWHLFQISSTADERLWNRDIFLYGGVEALAFAAAGFLFGREVNRERAEKADLRFESAKTEVAVARAEVEGIRGKAEALTQAIELKATAVSRSLRDAADPRAGGPSADELMELLDLAKRLFS